MKNLRNANQPPVADLVQRYLQSSWDVVTAVYDALAQIETISAAIDAGTLDDYLSVADIDTLAEVNAIFTDFQVGRFSTQGEAEAGLDNTTTMTPLRVAQAMASLSLVQNNFVAVTDPLPGNDTSEGYSVGSVWINTATDEAYRCVDASLGAAVWVNTSLTAAELATVALTGSSDDLSEGVVKLLLTVAERSKLAGIEAGATADQTGAEIKSAYEGEANTNAFTDAEQTKLAGIEALADVTDATNVAGAGAVMDSDYSAKGKILVGTGVGTWTALSTGTDAHVLTADSAEASGVKWAAAAGGPGGGLTVKVKAVSYTAVAGEVIAVKTDSGIYTITLPVTPSPDDWVWVQDADDNAQTNNITVGRNGSTIDGAALDFLINVDGGQAFFVYDGATWKVVYSTPGASGLLGIHTFRVPLSDLVFTSGATAGTSGSANTLKSVNFSATGYPQAHFMWAPPKKWDGGNIRWRYRWTPSNTDTNELQMNLLGEMVGEGDAISTASNNLPCYDNGLGVVDDIQVSPWSSWGTLGTHTVGEAFLLRIQRSDTDTFTGVCELLGAEIQYTTNAPTDD